MARKIIDISKPIEHKSPSEPFPADIRPITHRQGAEALGGYGGVPADEFPGGIGLAWEELTLITHAGTHFDAPWHFGPEVRGARAKTIDEVPLEWCFGDGVVLDLTHKKPAEYITTLDLQVAIEAIDYKLKPLDIVLLRTDADKKWGTPEYLGAHPGMTREATIWLIDRGIRVVGTDGYGFDRPFMAMLADHKAGKLNSLWPAHFAGRDREYCHIEKLAHLERIPRPHGFKVAVFPVCIKGASAGWCRAVAIVED